MRPANPRAGRWIAPALVAAALLAPGTAQARTVRVRSGDTLGEIAQKHGTTVSALIAANRGRYPDLTRSHVQSGWRLTVPSPASAARTQTAARETDAEGYVLTVRRGMTLGAIARAYALSVERIRKANAERYPAIRKGRIEAGWRLRLPGRAYAAPRGWRYIAERPYGERGVRITFRPGANRPVRDRLASLVEAAARDAQVDSIEISATTNGRHRRESRHFLGLSIDICEIDGTPVRDLGADRRVRAVQEAFRRRTRILENYGPARIEQNNRPYRPSNYNGIRLQHVNHIHIAL
ncbi:MAG: LysM peptidoglycan-binding domain-containing protein [Planctomycetes bacterium]|nr:LysM peptidoglycan-binding domain-containing protein [Planctomycetota bacterium]